MSHRKKESINNDTDRDHINTRSIAGGGVLTALALLFLILAAVSPTANLALFTFSSLCTAICIIRYGLKRAFLLFISVTVLSLIYPGWNYSLFFLGFFGSYPFVKALAERKAIGSERFCFRLNALLTKLIAMNLQLAAVFILVLWLMNDFMIDLAMIPLTWGLPVQAVWIFVVFTLQIMLLIYDWALTLLVTLYLRRMHNRI